MNFKTSWWRFKNLRIRLSPKELVQQAKFYAGIGIRSELRMTITRANGLVEDYGVVSRRVITDAGVAVLVATGQKIWDFNFHDCGTGNTAAAVTDVALVTPYGGARAVGSQSSATNTYTTVGVITFTGALSIKEHGIFNAAASVTLLDRTVHTTQAVASGDTITYTYVLTLPSGG